jgi:hypothetical protein
MKSSIAPAACFAQKVRNNHLNWKHNLRKLLTMWRRGRGGVGPEEVEGRGLFAMLTMQPDPSSSSTVCALTPTRSHRAGRERQVRQGGLSSLCQRPCCPHYPRRLGAMQAGGESGGMQSGGAFRTIDHRAYLPAPRSATHLARYAFSLSNLLDEVVEDERTLPEDDQVARCLREWQAYAFAD